MSDSKHHQSGPDHKGWLNKWTNYIKGYQKRWFVLQNGLLSYYRTQAEMVHTCRGTINLANAFIHTEDVCTFVISNGGTQHFYLKASSEVERQKWVTALELSKAKAMRMIESDSDEEQQQPDKGDIQNTICTLTAKLEDLNTCNNLISNHGTALQKSLSDLEQIDTVVDVSHKIKTINERATLFRITSNAMINACNDYVELAQNQGRKWQKMLQFEHEQRLKLEEMVEQLAKQQASFETKVIKAATASKETDDATIQSSDDESEFLDAVESQVEEFTVTLPYDSNQPPTQRHGHHRSDSGGSLESMERDDGEEHSSSESENEPLHGKEARVFYSKLEEKRKIDKLRTPRRTASKDSLSKSDHSHMSRRQRRRAILEKPNYSLNLWSILKNSIGKELSKIPMPVNINEPISLLQRLTEDLDYSECLDQAARCDDSSEELAYVTAYTISAYSTTTNRYTKPFNPLLGETYEFDRRDDYGWRTLGEQVSHHPVIAAFHTEGRGWTLWQEFSMTSKFRGKYLQVIPTGITHLSFEKSGSEYTWRKVTSTVHNIIVGKIWVDNHGEMDIVNHTYGDKSHVKFSAYSYFSKDTPRKVTAVITDKYGNAKWVLAGTWDDHMKAARVTHVEETNKGKPVFETGPFKVLWQRKYPPPGHEKMYNFTQFTVELNEMEEGVAPTDSRYRSDQRKMEEGEWDEANKHKLLLEEKQRAKRRRREMDSEAAIAEGREFPAYKPMWFRQEIDPQTGSLIHRYSHKYWESKERSAWSKCPDIYL